jgi:hypothetical protein
MNNKTIFDLINRTEHSDSRSVLSSIRVLYFAMIIGLLSFLAVTFLISQDFKFYFDKSDPVICKLDFILSGYTGRILGI